MSEVDSSRMGVSWKLVFHARKPEKKADKK